MMGHDPLTDTYREVGKLISSGSFDFSVKEKIDLQCAFVKDPNAMYMFMGGAGDIEMQKGLVLSIIDSYREEHGHRMMC